MSSRHTPIDRRAVDFSLYKAGIIASKLEVLTNLDINSEMPLLHEDYRAISQIVFKHVPCYLPWFFTLITSDGNVFPCCQCKGIMGNLSEKSFKEIWTGILYSRFRHLCKLLPENDGKPLKGCECDNCNYASRNLVFHRLIKPFDLNPAFGHSANIIGKLLKFKDI